MAVHIEGRRWFQRTYGNTYHSVRIYENGELLVSLPYQYGYGDQYLQTALDWLKANGKAPVDEPHTVGHTGTRYMREELGATWSVVDVARQKDL